MLIFMILSRDGAMMSADSFKILAEIPSIPVALEESSALKGTHNYIFMGK